MIEINMADPRAVVYRGEREKVILIPGKTGRPRRPFILLTVMHDRDAPFLRKGNGKGWCRKVTSWREAS